VLWREKAFKVLVLNASLNETLKHVRAERAREVGAINTDLHGTASQLRLARAAAADAEAQARLEASKARSAETAVRRAEARAEER
jgi:hypothetical protein